MTPGSSRCSDVTAEVADFFGPWRTRAREFAARGVRPEDAVWPEASQAPLWETPPSPNSYQSTPATMRVPAQLREMFETCACHCDPSRYARMYRVLWRSLHGEHAL